MTVMASETREKEPKNFIGLPPRKDCANQFINPNTVKNR